MQATLETKPLHDPAANAEGMTLQEACAKDLCEQFPSIPYGVVLTIIYKHFNQKN